MFPHTEHAPFLKGNNFSRNTCWMQTINSIAHVHTAQINLNPSQIYLLCCNRQYSHVYTDCLTSTDYSVDKYEY